MFFSLSRAMLLGLLCIQLTLCSCVSTPTIDKPIYKPFKNGRPLDAGVLKKIQEDSPKDAVFADLMQAFALMRTKDLNDPQVQQEILGLLATSVSSFEDMRDPVNFSRAFSIDESKPFRGRSYERMFASLMAAVLHIQKGDCSQALPYLRNAEFLDARFQKLPFGTDAPLIYALMCRCLDQTGADKQDIARAKQGVFRSVRFLTWQTPIIEALVELSEVDLRNMAVSNRLAYMIYEISIYHSLMTAPDQFSLSQMLAEAKKNSSLFIGALKSHFEEEYVGRIKPLMTELQKIYRWGHKVELEELEDLAFLEVDLAVSHIEEKLQLVFLQHPIYRARFESARDSAQDLTRRILTAAMADKLALTFSGYAPKIERQGSYGEISAIKPGDDSSTSPQIRKRTIRVDSACGFHRKTGGNFSLVMCKKKANPSGVIKAMPSLELLSMSRKATSAQGRRFDKILKGRAQFRAATEKAAEISAWSAFFLFYLGASLMEDCNNNNASQACYMSGLAVFAAAGLTAAFSGTIWLVGKASNPAADSRYVSLMYESIWLSTPMSQ